TISNLAGSNVMPQRMNLAKNSILEPENNKSTHINIISSTIKLNNISQNSNVDMETDIKKSNQLSEKIQEVIDPITYIELSNKDGKKYPMLFTQDQFVSK